MQLESLSPNLLGVVRWLMVEGSRDCWGECKKGKASEPPSIHSSLGTDAKKIKYEYSEHGLISFNPPSSEGFSEHNYGESW